MACPRCLAISSALGAVLNAAMVIFAIMEQQRLTPFHQELQCDTPPPMAMKLSLLRAPSPIAEALGLQPAAAPPFGLFLNVTTTTTCMNPGQASITMKAIGSATRLLSPNMTDLAVGGTGLPFTKMGEAKIMKDASFGAGGGEGEIITETQINQPLEDFLASMHPYAAMTGYSPSFMRSSQTVSTCMTLFGLPMCTEASIEEFCGNFGGSCLAESVDATGAPFLPPRFEPAVCGYTRSLCGKESDVLAQMKPEALGIEVVAKVPCPAATGLPQGTECNVISAPGLDPATHQARAVEPSRELTPEAQAEKDELLAQAEASVHLMILINIVVNSCFFLLNASLTVMRCRRVCRPSTERVSRHSVQGGVLEVADEAFEGTWHYGCDEASYTISSTDGKLFFQEETKSGTYHGQLQGAGEWREARLVNNQGEHLGFVRVQNRGSGLQALNVKDGEFDAWGPDHVATKMEAGPEELPRILRSGPDDSSRRGKEGQIVTVRELPGVAHSA